MDDAMRESLDAFVDGELPPREMERVAALLATRPELAVYVTQQEQLRAMLKMPSVMAQKPPQHLIGAVYKSPVSWRWRLGQLRRGLTVRALAPVGSALALGLVIGVALKPGSDFAMTNGQMVARGALADALSSKLASAGHDGNSARIGISFRNHGGQDCRTFTNGNAAGLACHSEAGWTVGTLINQAPESGGLYRMAGSEMPDAVRRAVANAIEGAPFDAAAEARARADGWGGK